MPTINSRPFIEQLIAANGRYADDTPIVKIVEYTNAWGKTAYGLIYKGQPLDSYNETEYVRNPIVIWEAA